MRVGWYNLATDTIRRARKPNDEIAGRLQCLIPGFDGAGFSREWKEALWARFTEPASESRKEIVPILPATLHPAVLVASKLILLHPLSDIASASR